MQIIHMNIDSLDFSPQYNDIMVCSHDRGVSRSFLPKVLNNDRLSQRSGYRKMPFHFCWIRSTAFEKKKNPDEWLPVLTYTQTRSLVSL